MRTTMVILILVAFLFPVSSLAQCNDDLVEIAIAKSGAGAQFMRDFRAKLPEGSLKTPLPIARFNTYLKTGDTYRFNIAQNADAKGIATLQLFDKSALVGTITSRDTFFDYQASRNGTFQVTISFSGGKAGCATGIMSLLPPNDLQGNLSEANSEKDMEVLYLEVENPISIITDKKASDSILISFDNGKIVKNTDSTYIALPSTEGLATLRVTIKSSAGRIQEEATSNFLVRKLPRPYATIQGLRGGIISKSLLQLTNSIQIDYPIDFEKYGYKILDFSVKADNGDARHISYSSKFEATLQRYLSNLPEDTKLIIDNIHVVQPSGQIITLEPLGFIIK